MSRSISSSRRALVAFQIAIEAALIVAACCAPRMAHAATSTIGRTWPIFEPDALAEIEANAASLPPNMARRFGPRSGWSALAAAPLGRATADRTRTVIPFHSLEMDIRLPDGRVLYPKGFTFNPLAFVSLPQRLVIVAPADLDWAVSEARPTDLVLLASADGSGNRRQPDIFTLSEERQRPLFLLEERVKDRLGLNVGPVIVQQVGQKLILDEVGPERLDRFRHEERR